MAEVPCEGCGLPVKEKFASGICSDFTPELRDILMGLLKQIDQEESVLLLFEDMIEINEHFQATLDWFKEHGNGMKRR